MQPNNSSTTHNLKDPRFKITLLDRYIVKSILNLFLLLMIAFFLILAVALCAGLSEEIGKVFTDSTTGTVNPWSILCGLFTIAKFCVTFLLRFALDYQFLFITLFVCVAFTKIERNEARAKDEKVIRGGEIISLYLFGFSRARIAIPIYITICATVFALCLLEEFTLVICRNWPGANSGSIIQKYEIQTMNLQNDPFTNIKIYGRDLNLETNSFNDAKVIIQKNAIFPTLDEIHAKQAQWLPETDKHPKGYMLIGVEDLDRKSWLSQVAQNPINFPELESTCPIFFTSETADWVEPGNLFFISILETNDLAREAGNSLPLSILGLFHTINDKHHTVSKQIEYTYELHKRNVRPFLECLFVCVLVPIVLSGRLNERWQVILWLIAMTFFYWILIFFFDKLALFRFIPPLLAAWSPLFILAIIASRWREVLYR